MTSTSARPVVRVLLEPGWAREQLIRDVREGLATVPRSIPPQWLYDNVGSDLFDRITRLEEYYPTECERAILMAHAAEIASISGSTHVVELGSGTSDKTRTLLDAFAATNQLTAFTPLDVSEQTLRAAADSLAERYPGVLVSALVGDFNAHLALLPCEGQRLVAFLGGTIGNYSDSARRAFLDQVAEVLTPGEHLLIGIDLVKSIDRLVAAYNDVDGVTEQFIRNCFSVLNRELHANFDHDTFEYVCLWDPARERIDMRLRSLRSQRVTITDANLEIDLARDEEISVETSAKFRVEAFCAELDDANFTTAHVWTDPAGDFALVLASRQPNG